MESNNGSFLTDIARAGDRPALLDLLAKAFRNENSTHPRFEELYPEMFLPTDEAMGRHLVIRDDSGRPVSCVGTYPIDFQIGPARVQTLGLGQVGTDPGHAGKGMMHALMVRAMTEMKKSRVSLGWLGGRHDRYVKYGWEWGESGLHISMDAKSMGAPPAGWTVREWSGTAAEFDRIWAMREAHPVRGVCPKAEWRLRMTRGNAKTWLAEKDGQAAFMVFHSGWKSALEWGGAQDGLLALLAKMAEAGPLSIQVQAELEPHIELFRSKSTGAGVSLAMLAVLDLETLAREFAPFIQPRMPTDRAIRLTILEQGREVTSATLSGRAAKEDPLLVALDRPRMTGFLFGPLRASQAAGLPDSGRWVDQVFPLPFVIPALFSV
jgi:predicted N-acetyltransferase YhbS